MKDHLAIPALPQKISPDGREIWDWAARVGQRSQLLHKQRELTRQIADIKVRCGSCIKWMTPHCPKEKHDNKIGRSRGPSANTYICGQFNMNQSSLGFIDLWGRELAELNDKL